MNFLDYYLTLSERQYVLYIIGIVFIVLVLLIQFIRDRRYPMNYTEEQRMLRKRRWKYDVFIDILDVLFVLITMMYCTAGDVCNLLEAGLIVLP